ncbi:MAG: DUF748 domain-containing protein [Steroidobacteraceae bacterium]|nr:DUF748 domain-containing protein [Deltaproteobacteria bacterium]
MSIKKKIALIGAISIVVLLLFSATLLPWIVRNQAVKGIGDATGRIAHIEKVSFNPFTLTITADGLGIEGGKGAPFIKIGSLRLSIGGASLYKRALIIDEVTVNSPALSFARLEANSYSFSDIVERLKNQPKKESKSDFRYSINNISIHNGSIDFDDRAIDGAKKHTVKNLEIAVPFISNIPYLVETYIEPRLSASINGSPFNFGGKLKPLSKSMESAVRLDLKGLDLPGYAAYSPVKLPVDLASGSLTVDAKINYRISADKKPELIINGELRLERVEINQKGGKALAKIPLLQINASRLEFFARQFAFNSILLEGVQIFAERDKKGVWNYARLLPAKPKAVPAAKPAKSNEKSAAISVASLVIGNGALHFSDALPAGGFGTTLSDIDVSVKNFSTAPDKSADYQLSMLMDNQATFSADGSFSTAPLTATASLELSELRLQKGWPYLAQFLTAPLKGTLDLSADLSYNRENGLKAANGSLALHGLSAVYGSREGFDLALLEIKGVSYDQTNNCSSIDEVLMSKGSLSLSKESDGSISLLSLIRKNITEIPAVASPAKPKTKPLAWNLKRFQLERFNATITDKSRAGNPRFTLNNSQLALTNLSGPDFRPAGLKFSSTFNKQTALKAAGMLTPLPFRYQGDISVGRLRIRDFEEYFPDALNVHVVGGTIDTALNVDIALKNGKPTGSFKGSCGVRSFHSVDAVAEEDLLKWESLQFDRVQGTLEPFSLGIHEVALNGAYSRIVVRKDGTLNLQNLMESQGQGIKVKDQVAAGQQPPVVKQESQVKARSAAAAPKTPITIGAVTVQDGTIFFTDRHLSQTFNSTFYNLGGRVSGLSSEETKLAEVDLRGNLENHSPLQITGQINPLRDELFIDLKLSFKDIDLSPVTPYSGTFLGYTIEKGKLFLDLKYKIDKKQLSSENNVFIDQFTFGTKVESAQATSLPVRLAVALLKDRKGEIHLDLPVTGRTDDPEFSIWGMIGQVVKNLISKAVTSPFALLSAMIGGGQDFSFIRFTSGSGSLTAAEEQKLLALAKALADRPGLKIEIKGYVEREKDAEGYRRELLNQKLRNEKFLLLAKERQLKEGESAEALGILPEETSKLLKAVYKKEKFPKPRNAIGLVKELPDDEMRKLIIASTVVGEAELQRRARERATAVMNFLVEKGALPSERLFQKNDDIHKAPEKEGTARSRVEFNAIAQ